MFAASGYVRILRPVNCAMAALAVFIGAKTALGSAGSLQSAFPVAKLIFASTAAFLICGAGNTINDFFDYVIDTINKPFRPIPKGEVRLRSARMYSIFLFLAGIFFSIFINFLAFLLALLNSALLYLYAAEIKKKGGFMKNILVSYLVASPFLYGSFATLGRFYAPQVIALALLAFLANMGREIVKDIEDLKGDRSAALTLPSLYGVKISSKIASFFIFLAILLSPLPYFTGLMNLSYLFFILLGDMLFVVSIRRLSNATSETAKNIQAVMKVGMLLALLAFLFGSL